MSNSLAVMKADPQRNIILLKKLKVCANAIKENYDTETKELGAFVEKIKWDAIQKEKEIAAQKEKEEREAKLFKDEEMRQWLKHDIFETTPTTFTEQDMRNEMLADYARDAQWEFELDDDME